VSSRADLKTAVIACLARITVAGGYHTDAGNTVTGEPGQIAADALAGVGVMVEAQTHATDPAAIKTHRLTTVAVIVKVPAAQGNAQARLDLVLDDVEAAMADQQFRYPHRITFPQYQSMQPVIAEPGQGWVGAVLRYTSHIPIR
jgi:hypothetical protein